MTVIFATCHQQPLVADDDRPLAEALERQGVSVTPVPWTEIEPAAAIDAPPVVLRSTWDYHLVPTLFYAWLRAIGDSARAVWNPAATAHDNVDKIYLRDLEARGIAIPRTLWLDRPDAGSIEAAVAAYGWDRAVLKPRIAATAHGTFLVSNRVELSAADLAPARATGALLQEFVRDIDQRGETSLVFFDGRFSHAVSKLPAGGDYRVQKDFGGSVEAVTPSAGLLAFAERVMSLVPAGTLYARVDCVETARGPLLMEVELIEPELYFTVVDGAADRLADHIVRRL